MCVEYGSELRLIASPICVTFGTARNPFLQKVEMCAMHDH
jgi:hypothetical protein